MKIRLILTLVAGLMLSSAHAESPQPSPAPKSRAEEWEATRRQIMDECVKPSYRQEKCHRMEKNISFDYSPAAKVMFCPIYSGVLPAGRAIKETAWALSLLASPDQKTSWTKDSVGKEYDALKLFLEAKAERESLSECQKACLSTCVSSRILTFEENAGKTYRGAIESGRGECREFSLVAVDLMEALGLEASVAPNTQYMPSKNGMVPAGKHVVVRVKVDSKDYLLEPQSPGCNLYPLKFTKSGPK